MSYFPKPLTHSKNKIKVELDLANYATKLDARSVDASEFAKKTHLASLKGDINKIEKVASGLSNLKSKVNKLHVDRLEPVPIDLKRLCDVVHKEIVKKDVYW